ncbi:MAG: hypothetical protein ABI551_03700, partial [Polyangiaceae bacterium]
PGLEHVCASDYPWNAPADVGQCGGGGQASYEVSTSDYFVLGLRCDEKPPPTYTLSDGRTGVFAGHHCGCHP